MVESWHLAHTWSLPCPCIPTLSIRFLTGPLERHVEGGEDQLGPKVIGHGPADNSPAEHIRSWCGLLSPNTLAEKQTERRAAEQASSGPAVATATGPPSGRPQD